MADLKLKWMIRYSKDWFLMIVFNGQIYLLFMVLIWIWSYVCVVYDVYICGDQLLSMSTERSSPAENVFSLPVGGGWWKCKETALQPPPCRCLSKKHTASNNVVLTYWHTHTHDDTTMGEVLSLHNLCLATTWNDTHSPENILYHLPHIHCKRESFMPVFGYALVKRFTIRNLIDR